MSVERKEEEKRGYLGYSLRDGNAFRFQEGEEFVEGISFSSCFFFFKVHFHQGSEKVVGSAIWGHSSIVHILMSYILLRWDVAFSTRLSTPLGLIIFAFF